MGFYSASQIVQDARRGAPKRAADEFANDEERALAMREPVGILPVDVMHSDWDCTLVGGTPRQQPAVRLGLREVRGLSEAAGQAIVSARTRRIFTDLQDLRLRAQLDEKACNALAEANALQGLVGHRHAARWAVAGIERRRPLLPGSPREDDIALPAPRIGEEILSDYRATGLSLAAHPMALLRPQMQVRRIKGSLDLRQTRHGRGVHVAGLVTQRQRPATAKGTIFVTLEDEHGMINVIVWPDLAARQRKPLLDSTLLAVRGRWERVDGVEHLIAGQLHDLSALLGELHTPSRDFR